MLYSFLAVLWLVLFATPVYAQEPAQISEVAVVIKNIIRLLAPVASVIFLVMVIYGGFKYIRSRGDPKNTEEARNVLQYAIIGAVLVAASWLILQLIGQLTGADVTNIVVPTPAPTP